MTSSLVCIQNGPKSVAISSNGPPSRNGGGGPAPSRRRQRGGAPDDRLTARPRDVADLRHLRRPALGTAICGGPGSRRIVSSASISWLTCPRSKIRISSGRLPDDRFHGREHASLTDGE